MGPRACGIPWRAFARVAGLIRLLRRCDNEPRKYERSGEGCHRLDWGIPVRTPGKEVVPLQ